MRYESMMSQSGPANMSKKLQSPLFVNDEITLRVKVSPSSIVYKAFNMLFEQQEGS
jgi:hypothetical protein